MFATRLLYYFCEWLRGHVAEIIFTLRFLHYLLHEFDFEAPVVGKFHQNSVKSKLFCALFIDNILQRDSE